MLIKTLKNIFLLISILLIGNLATAQSTEEKITALKLSIQEEEDDLTKANLYIDLSKIYHQNDPNEGLITAHKALNIGKSLKESTIIFEAYVLLFDLHYNITNQEVINDSLRVYIELIEKESKKINRPLYTVKSLYKKGIFEHTYNHYETALEYYIEAYELSEKYDISKNLKANLLNGISNVSYINKNYTEALEYYKKVLTLVSDELQKGITLLNIASIYKDKFNQHDTAQVFFNQAHEYFKKSDSKQWQAIVLINQGGYFDYKKEFDKALVLYQEAYQLIDNNKLHRFLNTINRSFASHYYLSEQYELAIEYGEKTMDRIGGIIAEEEETYQMLYKTYAKIGAYEKAFQLQQDYVDYKDSMEMVNLNDKVEELQTKFKVQEQKAENELLKSNIQRKNILGIAAILILILSAILIWILKRSTQLKKLQNEILEQKVAERTSELLSTTKELEYTKKIKLLEEAKSRFFANVSHEFRTPLTIIQSPIQSILKSPRLDFKEKKMMKRALSNSKHLSRLVNQVLDLSKFDANKMTLNEQPIVLFLLIRRIIANFETYAQGNGITLQLEYRIYNELKISLDKDKFEKILNNYISNAIKFTPRDGKISIIVTDLQADIQIAVQDTGIGIPKTEIDAVFDRYYQVKGYEKNTLLGEVNHYTGGTGIGLSLCKDYAQLLNGKVWVESPNEYGSGSTFYFQFPKKELFEATDDQDALKIKELQGIPITAMPLILKDEILSSTSEEKSKILIVEDNRDLRDFLGELLEENYEVTTVENGQAALDKLNDFTFELIISDVMMPIMDGFKLIEKLKSSEKYRHIPMMMLTARAALKDKLKALRLGVDDYMLKPFDEGELKARVSNLILNFNSRREVLINDKSKNEQIDTLDLGHSDEENEWLQDLERKVFSNVSNVHFTSDRLAEELLMSRSHLFRKIKTLTGLTVNQYIKEAKLQTARTLLEEGQVRSVKETAYQVGFKHVHYFSKVYEQRFGRRPSEYL